MSWIVVCEIIGSGVGCGHRGKPHERQSHTNLFSSFRPSDDDARAPDRFILNRNPTEDFPYL
jgi:hypothetical protein